MADSAVWKIAHALSILSQLGLIVAGGGTFALDSHRKMLQFISFMHKIKVYSGTDEDVTDFAILRLGELLDAAPFTVFFLGGLGFFTFLLTFCIALRLQMPPDHSETKASHDFRRRSALFASLVAQCGFGVLEIVIGVICAHRHYWTASVFSILAGTMGIATFIVDICQLREDYRGDDALRNNEIEIDDDEMEIYEPYYDTV